MNKKQAVVEALPHLMRYARALTRNATAADDLVQDCVHRALSRLHLFAEGTNMRAWLFTILHNIHRQGLRANARRTDTAVLDDSVTSTHGIEASQPMALAIGDLHEALGRLPEDQRQVVLLVGLEDLSYKEVSEILDIPMGTVMSRLSRGREKLKSLMEGEIGAALRSVT